MEVSLVENMPSVSLCKKLLNHLHFICLARGLDVTRPVIITNALTSINNHIIIEHNNYCKIISCLRKYFNFKDKKFFILQCFIFYIVIIQNITYNI